MDCRNCSVIKIGCSQQENDLYKRLYSDLYSELYNKLKKEIPGSDFVVIHTKFRLRKIDNNLPASINVRITYVDSTFEHVFYTLQDNIEIVNILSPSQRPIAFLAYFTPTLTNCLFIV